MKNIPKKYTDLLEKLDLSPTQSQIYLATLSNGLSSVLDITKLTGISRQQIYTDAEKLVELGLLDKTRKERRKYIAARPSALNRLAQEKIQKAEIIASSIKTELPLLEKLIPTNSSDVQVKFFEGKRNMQTAYQRELQQAKNTEVLSLAGSIDNIFEFFPESYWQKWNAKFIKKGNSSRMLAHASEAAKETLKFDTEYNRQTRLLSSFPLKVNIDIFEQTVLIVSFHDEIAIWIDSPVIAESYRILFELLWSQAE